MKKSLVTMLLLFGATAAYGDIFTWKDAKGTLHYTNSLHEIPARYLKKARVLNVATGKVGGLATAQPPQPAQPALQAQNVPASNPAPPPAQPVQQPAQQPPVQPLQQPQQPGSPAGPVAASTTPVPSVPPPAAFRYPKPTSYPGAGTTASQPQPGRRAYRSGGRGRVEEE